MEDPNEHWFWLKTPTACGAVITDLSGFVIDGAPYFMAFMKGRSLHQLLIDRTGWILKPL